jgi:hypothetical protein
MNDLDKFCNAWEAKRVKPRISFIESPDFDTMADLMMNEKQWLLVFFRNGKFVCDAAGQKGNTLDTVLPGS